MSCGIVARNCAFARESLWLPEEDKRRREEEMSKDWFLDRKLAQQSAATERVRRTRLTTYTRQERIRTGPFVFPWWVWLSSLLVILAGEENTIRLISLKSYGGTVRDGSKERRTDLTSTSIDTIFKLCWRIKRDPSSGTTLKDDASDVLFGPDVTTLSFSVALPLGKMKRDEKLEHDFIRFN